MTLICSNCKKPLSECACVDLRPTAVDLKKIKALEVMGYLAEFEKVTRVELIVNGRRKYNTWAASHVAFSLQDKERTLKVFLKEEIND